MDAVLQDAIERAMNGDTHALGAALSPLDDRDYVQYPPSPGAPDSVQVKGLGNAPVYTQQGGTCTGYSLAAVLSYLEYAETGQRRTFDGSELHHRIVRSYEAGLWPRDLLVDVLAHGAEAQTTAEASGLYFIGGYAGVPLDPDSILTALSTTGPLQVVTWLGQAFMNQWNSRQDTYLPAPPSQEQAGLHSMLIVAADRARGAVIQNNWGVGGGVPFAGVPGGFHKVSWDWLRVQGGEAWAIADRSNADTEGWIRNHEQQTNEAGVALVKRPDRPAVYAVLGETRDWISSQQELYARGLGGLYIRSRDKSDPIWGFPVVGADAPPDQRA